MLNSIENRKKTLENKINIFKSRNIIDEALIEEEYKSIKFIQSNGDISNVNTNISKKDLTDKKILGNNINKEKKDINKSENKNVFDLTEEERIKYLEYRNRVSDEGYFDKIKDILKEIPNSNGSRYYEKINTNIGIIADEFLMHSYMELLILYILHRIIIKII